MRGVGLIVAVTLPKAVDGLFGTGSSEHSSGANVNHGGITRAGNALARRVLIEGALTYRMQARVSRKLHDRIEELPSAIRDIAWKAQVRLCARYRRLVAAGKQKVIIVTAIAREMVGLGSKPNDVIAESLC